MAYAQTSFPASQTHTAPSPSSSQSLLPEPNSEAMRLSTLVCLGHGVQKTHIDGCRSVWKRQTQHSGLNKQQGNTDSRQLNFRLVLLNFVVFKVSFTMKLDSTSVRSHSGLLLASSTHGSNDVEGAKQQGQQPCLDPGPNQEAASRPGYDANAETMTE